MTKIAKKTKTTTNRKPRAVRKPKIQAAVIALPAPEPIIRATKSVVRDVFKVRAQNGILRNDALGLAIKSAFLGATNGREACDDMLGANGLEVGRWTGKNTGLLRMNITNVARAILKNNGTFVVRGHVYDATEGLTKIDA